MNKREKIFQELITDNRRSIYRICLAYLYDRSHADDLYQEILMQIWKSLDSYKGTAKINTWIYRVALNTAITYNVKHKRHKTETLLDTENIADGQQQSIHEQEKQLKKLHHAISLLEEHDRLIISLVLEGLSYKEIAEITGNSVNNTGVRINRIKTRLTSLINPKSDKDGF